MATEATDWRGRLALIAASVILTAWTISFIMDIAVKTYDPPASVTPLAMASVGFLFGAEVMAKMKPSEPPSKPKPEEVET